jgi:hypothetical protein
VACRRVFGSGDCPVRPLAWARPRNSIRSCVLGGTGNRSRHRLALLESAAQLSAERLPEANPSSQSPSSNPMNSRALERCVKVASERWRLRFVVAPTADTPTRRHADTPTRHRSALHNFLNFCFELWHAPGRVVVSSNFLLAGFDCFARRL